MYEKRVVPKDKVNLMFMRYSKGTIKVLKNGVTLKLYGQELQYSTEDLWREYFGRDVYVRYSPDDLSSVRVYNTDNQFICEAPMKTKLSFNATKEEIQKANRENNAAIKAVKNHKKLKGIEVQKELDAIMNNSDENLELPENINAKIYEIIQPNEQLQKAIGFGNEFDEPIPWTEALERQKELKFNNND